MNPLKSSYGVLMLDIEGKSLTKLEEDLIERDSVGGVILFTRNYESPAQLRELVASIRAINCDILIAAAIKISQLIALIDATNSLSCAGLS